MPCSTPELQREYQRKWLAKRRASFFSGKSCVKCGSTENLELDHIDPAAKVRRSDHLIWSWSEPRRLAEIEKCQVLCSDCHLIKTIEYISRPIRHGTTSGYEHYGCKCKLCLGAAAEYKRQWRARTGKN